MIARLPTYLHCLSSEEMAEKEQEIDGTVVGLLQVEVSNFQTFIITISGRFLGHLMTCVLHLLDAAKVH